MSPTWSAKSFFPIAQQNDKRAQINNRKTLHLTSRRRDNDHDPAPFLNGATRLGAMAIVLVQVVSFQTSR
jgi:hypothetical protein